jgi:hypothetical protein
MQEGLRFVNWRSEQFRFERLADGRDLAHLSPVWAVSRGREFIGNMSCAEAETAREFQVRCVRWLSDLLG